MTDRRMTESRRSSLPQIAAPDSPRRILVIPTNEELVIARDTVRLAKS